MAPRETENNAYAKFSVTIKAHYGMLWYFLEWTIQHGEGSLYQQHDTLKNSCYVNGVVRPRITALHYLYVSF